jgi:hypothetical protein
VPVRRKRSVSGQTIFLFMAFPLYGNGYATKRSL